MNEPENETRTCSDCGAEFAFGAEERRFFEERSLTPPKRCRACRRARKAERSFAPAGDRGGGGDRGAPRRFDGPSDARPARPAEGFRGPSEYGSGGGVGAGAGAGERRPRFDDRRGFRPRSNDRRPSQGGDAPRPQQSAPHSTESAPRPRKERPKYDITCQQCGAAAQVPFKPIEGRALFCKPCYDARKGTAAARSPGANAPPSDGAASAPSAPASTPPVPEE